MPQETALCWLRRDLRVEDNAALYTALERHSHTVCIFVFDQEILAPLPRQDRRVDFIWQSLQSLKQRLRQHGSDLVVAFGRAHDCLCRFAIEHQACAVYAAQDGEPMAQVRDQHVASALARQGVALRLVQDQVIFTHTQILNRAGHPYTVFTPYKNAWLAYLMPEHWQPWHSHGLLHKLKPLPEQPFPSLTALGFTPTDVTVLGWEAGEHSAQSRLQAFHNKIDHYHTQRDYPAHTGSSQLSPHLRFGTLSIRAAVALAAESSGPGAAAWLNELIWREFYQQLLWHYPHVVEESFRPRYRQLVFPNRRDWFEAWCEGQTGYPLIDAGMRQLRTTGWMHNRLRMLTASFLVKDLLIDWRWGEAHFAKWLLDFDLASNNGGWQWAASTGCDAQPWFRIFNPLTQSQRFDAEGDFIRRFVPELASLRDTDIHAPWLARSHPTGFTYGADYPLPLVDHARQRTQALALFGQDTKD